MQISWYRNCYANLSMVPSLLTNHISPDSIVLKKKLTCNKCTLLGGWGLCLLSHLHWHAISTSFVQDYQEKMSTKYWLFICTSSCIFKYIEECKDFESALFGLDSQYVKSCWWGLRHLLAARTWQIIRQVFLGFFLFIY